MVLRMYSEIIRDAEVCAMDNRRLWKCLAAPGWLFTLWPVIKWCFKALWAALEHIQNVQFIYQFYQSMQATKGWNLNLLPHFDLIVFVLGIVWLTILVLWPTRRSADVGRVEAYAEVWNPFPITDRDPRITIEFAKSLASKKSGTRGIWLCNDGGTDAFKVQVLIDLSSGRVTFKKIPQIRVRDKVEAKIESPVHLHDLELLMTAGTKCYILSEDHSERRFKTNATLSHDMVTGLTVARDYSFCELKLAKPRRFSFVRWPKFMQLA